MENNETNNEETIIEVEEVTKVEEPKKNRSRTKRIYDVVEPPTNAEAILKLFLKIQEIKVLLDKANLKKTGINEYSNFKYYELSDIMPSINKLCLEKKLFTKINFYKEEAELEIYDLETGASVRYNAEIKQISIKGANELQSYGGVQTYLRRYLYMSAFDISESDLFDKTSGADKDNKPAKPKTTTSMTSCTKGQIEIIKNKFTEEEIASALKIVKKEKIEDLSVVEATSLIKSKDKTEEK